MLTNEYTESVKQNQKRQPQSLAVEKSEAVQPPSSNTGVGDTFSGNFVGSDLPEVLACGFDAISFTVPTIETVALCRQVMPQLEAYQDSIGSLNGASCLIRGGAMGYQCSVERGGIRAFLSTSERMGVHVRVGSALCMRGLSDVLQAVGDFLQEVLNLDPLEHDMRITRFDVFADVAAPMPAPEHFLSRVGRVSKLGGSHWKEGEEFKTLETQYVGSTSSAIRLRVYNKLASNGHKVMYDAADLDAWGCTEDTLPAHVTRFEWQIRAKDAGLDFDLGTLHNSVGALTEYLHDWFRLVVPSDSDSNKSRWPLLPVFAAALGAIQAICEAVIPLDRSGAGVGRLLRVDKHHAAAVIVSYLARLTDKGRDHETLNVFDILEALEGLLASPGIDAVDRYQRRYLKESLLSVQGV